MSCINKNFILKPHHRWTRFHAGTTRDIHGIPILDVHSNVSSICGLKIKLHPFLPYLSCLKRDFYQQLCKIRLKTAYCISNIADSHVACEQALLFGEAKRASRERAREGLRKGELAMISRKFSFPPWKPRDSAKRENRLA